MGPDRGCGGGSGTIAMVDTRLDTSRDSRRCLANSVVNVVQRTPSTSGSEDKMADGSPRLGLRCHQWRQGPRPLRRRLLT